MRKTKTTYIQEELLYWYDNEYIMLPWREDTDPYKIWISEIMLQQTRVEAVIPYFERFIKRLPTIKELAEVEEDELMKLWQGLGYYRRAKNLQFAAKQIMDDYHGVMPKTAKDLKNLKGIGDYTAGAISSIAFNQVEPAVDGNILRIFARLFGVKEDIRKNSIKKELTELYKPFIPNDRPGDFNQALMDLGRKICIPSKNPKCEECPIMNNCYAYNHSMQDTIPYLSKKKAQKQEDMTILIFMNTNKVWLKKRPENGLLASLYEYTTLEGHLTKEDVRKYVNNSKITIQELPKSKHMFTHIRWDMVGYLVDIHNDKIDDIGLFVEIDEVETIYSIPTAFKTYTNWLLNNKR